MRNQGAASRPPYTFAQLDHDVGAGLVPALPVGMADFRAPTRGAPTLPGSAAMDTEGTVRRLTDPPTPCATRSRRRGRPRAYPPRRHGRLQGAHEGRPTLPGSAAMDTEGTVRRLTDPPTPCATRSRRRGRPRACPPRRHGRLQGAHEGRPTLPGSAAMDTEGTVRRLTDPPTPCATRSRRRGRPRACPPRRHGRLQGAHEGRPYASWLGGNGHGGDGPSVDGSPYTLCNSITT